MAFHFLRPYWFLLLIPLAFMLWGLLRYLKKGDSWQQVIDPTLLKHLLNQSSSTQNFKPLVLLGVIWFIATFALAGPTWEKRQQPVFRNNDAKVVLLDLSQSMLAEDIQPNRLTRAKYKILDLLRDYPEGQTGMAVFSSEAYTVSPLTSDTHTIALMVPDLSPDIMPVLGSNIGIGLEKAADLLKQGEAKSGTIILVTDSSPTAADDAIAKRIHSEGYTISVLAIGTAQGAPVPSPAGSFEQSHGKTLIAKLNIQGLEQLATEGDGRFSSFTNTDSDINYIMAPTLQHSRLNAVKQKVKSTLWYDEGRWFILLVIPFALLVFRRGWLEELLQ